jgi:hypothetical protein
MARTTGRSTQRWIVAGTAIVVVVAAVVLWVAGDGDDETAGSVGTTTTSTTSTPTTTAPTTTTSGSETTATTVPADATVLWPFPGSTSRFTTPEQAARSFAVEVLRFQEPVVEAFRQGDTRSGEVPVRAAARGPETTVLVRQVGPGDDWSVLGSVTENISVTSPAAGAVISSPVAVAGRAVAFEGTVQVEVRADGQLGPIGAGFVTGGGDEPRPFNGSVPFETPGAPYGALVFFTTSAEDGRVWEATAFRVAFGSTDSTVAACGSDRPPRPRPAPGQMEVTAYFTCDAPGDGGVRGVYRLVPASPRVLDAALEALLAGPTGEERAGALSSFFSDATTGMLRSVTVTDGHAVVDFEDLRPVIPNASASAGSARLLSELDATVFQFRDVESAEYRLEGSCTDFNEWLQFGGCEPRRRGTSTD